MAPKTPRGKPQITVIDPATLSPEDIASLRAAAEAKINEEIKQKTRDAMFAQFLDEERRKRNPSEEIKYITLDLAEHSDRIMVDGQIFFHGLTYGVPRSLYCVMRETIQAGHRHQDEVDGKLNRNNYRKPLGARVTPAGVLTGVAQ